VRGDSEIADAVRQAASARESVRIAGRGTWLDGGHIVRAVRTVSLADDTGVVEYTPGDLTITVRAGTTLREIDDVLLERDQWLPLDPMGGRDVSIGATVATCSYGPLAELFGTPRDQVLGLTVVAGTGDVLYLGGRVVKNVAGFDLTRLMIGSWGTLGIITQMTLRVRGQQKTLHASEHMRRAMPSAYGYREPIVTHPALSGAIKRVFDPYHVLNPGIMREEGDPGYDR
jgi:glycolate oxidase FAD binding subunit